MLVFMKAMQPPFNSSNSHKRAKKPNQCLKRIRLYEAMQPPFNSSHSRNPAEKPSQCLIRIRVYERNADSVQFIQLAQLGQKPVSFQLYLHRGREKYLQLQKLG